MNAVVEIAHDIRSPLSSILFLVDTIRRGQSGKVSPVQERQLGLVYGAALGLSTLSSDLIDAVRGERLVDGRPIPFSVTEIILSVCAIVQPISEEKGLPLHASYPSVDGRVGYPSAINRVLLNLTTNALRYTDAGSVSIGCTELERVECVEFWVEDTGRGIPDSVLAMLFDGFRPGSIGIRFSSAGLGLAISRTLLEAMGSSLKVERRPRRDALLLPESAYRPFDAVDAACIAVTASDKCCARAAQSLVFVQWEHFVARSWNDVARMVMRCISCTCIGRRAALGPEPAC